MAITFEDLQLDCEKRMVALGYEDLEELYSPDHDIKSLRMLKRRLMDEAKEKRELKKEQMHHPSNLKNTLIKLSKLYKKDFYVYNGIFILPGKISQESLKGKFLIVLKEEFVDSIKQTLFKEEKNTILYIKDVGELKTLVEENITNKDEIYQISLDRQIIEDVTDKQSQLVKKIETELESIKHDSEYFVPVNIDTDDEQIISVKKIFCLKYKDFPNIECNIQLFPFFTEKERPTIEFMSDDFESNRGVKLYYARFHEDYEYFNIYFTIYYF